MKVAVVEGRVSLIIDSRVVDAASASRGAISSDPAQVFIEWAALQGLAAELKDTSGFPLLDETTLMLPMAPPRQVFGIGVNYSDHASEAGMEVPPTPLVFPKFASSIAGPNDVVTIDSAHVDWEAELVVVIGKDARDISSADDAWSVVAGLTIGQDISDREVQFENGATPQFGLGKSAPGFGPIGPWIVSTDEFARVPALDISCEVNGIRKQHSNTRYLMFGIPALIQYLSSRVQLLAGDVIFTGTPSGVGWGRNPKEYLAVGDVITTTIAGIGTLRTTIGEK